MLQTYRQAGQYILADITDNHSASKKDDRMDNYGLGLEYSACLFNTYIFDVCTDTFINICYRSKYNIYEFVFVSVAGLIRNGVFIFSQHTIIAFCGM